MGPLEPVDFTNIYTSVACNRTTEAADWGNNGLIIFGANNSVAILDPKFNGKSAKILHTYVRHSKRVNTVQWLRASPEANEQYFLSGADDGLAVLWHVERLQQPICYTLEGHSSGVNAVAGLNVLNGDWVLATAAADSTIKLWRFRGVSCECTQTIDLKRGFCFALRLICLPKTDQVLLAFSSDDETVSLWVQRDEATKDEFQFVHKLSGHEDWVRGLDSTTDGDDLLLASSAQDNFIRLWRISPRSQAEVSDNNVNVLKLNDETTGDIRVEETIVQLGVNVWYAISLESVLYGHDGWVYGVQWHKSEQQGLRLLSASIDKTLIIWAASAEEGVWLEQTRVGEVGGNSLGFFGGKFSSDGKSILGHSYQGGFHIWQQCDEIDGNWTPTVIVSGHFAEVRDLAWEPQGAYLMSLSADQTTRIHAPWQSAGTWHELARPQVHGYDMQSLALLSRYKFASGAEEKIVRTFQAPANFVDNFRSIAGIGVDVEGDTLLRSLPKGASVPSLGLSNKAVYDVECSAVEKHVKDEYPENYFVPIELSIPPQEETLMQNTLWPELQKLYGHGFEIFALAASPDGAILASSCRATTPEHAQIILWNTTTWKQIQKLPSHQLTVTQMRFSPNGLYLLSVSRDRRWTLFERTTDGSSEFQLAATTDKTNGVHARIIWACDWSQDSKYFVTGSRDGKAVIWAQSGDVSDSSLKRWRAVQTLQIKGASITAVAFGSNQLSDGAYVVALGYETGLLDIYRFDGNWSLLLQLNNDQAHHAPVKRLQFRPQTTESTQLASCGDDSFVRVYELKL